MQQLKDQIVLVPFAEWPQHSGQPVVQGAEPAELVEPSQQIAVPADQRTRGARGPVAGLAFGVAADGSSARPLRVGMTFLPAGIAWWLDSRKSSNSWPILLVMRHVRRRA